MKPLHLLLLTSLLATSVGARPRVAPATFDPQRMRTLMPAVCLAQARAFAEDPNASPEVAEAALALVVESQLKMKAVGNAVRTAAAFEAKYPGSSLTGRVRLMKSWGLVMGGQTDAGVAGLCELAQSKWDREAASESRRSLVQLFEGDKLKAQDLVTAATLLPVEDSLFDDLRASFEKRFASQGKPVLLVLPSKGEVGRPGLKVLRGAQAALERERVASYVIEETQDAAATLNAMRRAVALVEPRAVVGPMMSSVAVVAAAAFSKDYRDLPLILPAATSPGISGLSPMVWQLNFTTASQGRAMARYAWNCLEAREAAVLWPKGEYGDGLADGFRQAFEARGGRILWQQPYAPGRIEFRSHMDGVKKAWGTGRKEEGPLVFAPVETPAEILGLEDQAVKAGLDVRWLGASGWHTSNFLKDTQGKLDGAVISTDWAPDERRPEWKAFADGYKGRWKEAPDRMSALGWDAARLAAGALSLKSGVDIQGAEGVIRFDPAGRFNVAVPLLKVSRTGFGVLVGDCLRKP